MIWILKNGCTPDAAVKRPNARIYIQQIYLLGNFKHQRQIHIFDSCKITLDLSIHNLAPIYSEFPTKTFLFIDTQ